MTAPPAQHVGFDLDGDVPFLLNVADPVFSMRLNAWSVVVAAAEGLVTNAVKDAGPEWSDARPPGPAVTLASVARQRAAAHRQHVEALVRRWSGLRGTLDDVTREFDQLAARRSPRYRIAYIADLAAAAALAAGPILANERTLLRPGDERVASLFLWHLAQAATEPDAALAAAHALPGGHRLRLRILPSAARHLAGVLRLVADGFNAHVPIAERRVDARALVPGPRQAVAAWRMLLAPTPLRRWERPPPPLFAFRWLAHAEEGGDVAHWYSSAVPFPAAPAERTPVPPAPALAPPPAPALAPPLEPALAPPLEPALAPPPEPALAPPPEPAVVPPAPAHGFHRLTVAETRRLTADSVVITFDVPPGLAERFRFVQGQHVSVRVQLDGVDVRRTYSICAPVSSGSLRIAVKRVEGGVFSQHAVDRLTAGDSLLVSPPTGSFHTELSAGNAHHYAAVVGGSGITPVLSILATTLEAESASRFTLVYANRDAGSVMFGEELAELGAAHGHRLRVVHVLEDLDGRVDAARLGAWLADGTLGDVDTWFLCGPSAMADAVQGALADLGVRDAAILRESFTPGRGGVEPTARHPDAELTFTLAGRTMTTTVTGQTVLEAALATGADAPWSCREGLCGTCRAKLRDGTVEMATTEALLPAELRADYVLTCQARPTSERVVIDYDQ